MLAFLINCQMVLTAPGLEGNTNNDYAKEYEDFLI
jgi:hypothetical protein